ncbi:SDR family oxidoreductase [Streptobacillus moniliformis]|uniref:SDR family oxidoreductase n=1 Tax=Streptobacillus moniliformis TaxID=34105 RepID=UPI0007E48F1B|nr:SDR family oxidoreductase [Streptobacillus moniliformis]
MKVLENKVVVITGAGGIICSEMAKFLSEKGCKIALLDLSFEMAKKVSDEINENGGDTLAIRCNVLDIESIKKAKEEVDRYFGGCDILINGAGGNSLKATTDNEYHELNILNGIKSFFDLEKEGIEFVFDLNILGTILPTQVFAKDMIGRKGANIINISSMNAYTPLTKIPAYSGAKAAVSNFTQWTAVHFSHVGLRCNAIAPGFLRTKQNEKLLFDDNGNPTKRTEKILNSTPMGRFVKPEELNGVLEFLADSDKSSAVTGICIPVDCGFSAYSGV